MSGVGSTTISNLAQLNFYGKFLYIIITLTQSTTSVFNFLMYIMSLTYSAYRNIILMETLLLLVSNYCFEIG